MVIRKVVAIALLVGLVACDRKPPETVLSGNGDDSAKTSVAAGGAVEPELLEIPSSAITVFNPLRRENGTWTGKGCTWTTPANKDIVEATVGSRLAVDGYFLTHESGDPGSFEFVLLGKAKSYAIPVRTNYDRPDVAEYFKSPNALHTGYRFAITLEGVDPGSYDVDLFYQVDGVDFFCETGKKLLIK